MSFSKCSQASSSTPLLSSYPAEIRVATDYDQSPSNQYLIHHWNHARTHYYCDECGSLVSTAGLITYHGTTTTADLLLDHEDVASASEDSDSNESARTSFITSSKRSGDGSRLHRSPEIRHKRPALVRMRPMHRPWSKEGAIARYAQSIGHAL